MQPPPLPPKRVSLATPANSVKSPQADRRALLRYVFAFHGGAGAPADAALDALDVDKLVSALSRGQVFETGGVLFPARQQAPAANAPVTQQLAAAAAVLAVPAVPPPPLPPQPSAASAAPDSEDASPSDASTSEDEDGVALPASGPQEPPVALDCAPLRELGEECGGAAIQLYVAACRPELHDFARAQLGVAPVLVQELLRVLPQSSLLPADLVSLRLPAHLLTCCGTLGPKDMRRWRLIQTALLLRALPEAHEKALRARVVEADACAVAEACSLLDAASWSLPVDPCGIALYSLLVGCQWDDLDETSGVAVDEAPRFLSSLQPLWPGLGCTARAHAAHCVFSAFQRWTSSQSIDALTTALRSAVALAASFGEGGAPTADELAHLRATLQPVLTRSLALLNDYHLSFPFGADEAFTCLLNLSKHAATVLCAAAPGAPSTSWSAEPLVLASMTAAYARCVAEVAPKGVGSANIVALTRRADALLDAELERFSAVLQLHEPRAVCIAVSQLQALFARDLHAWLRAGGGIENLLPGLKAAELFTAHVQSAAIGGALGEPPAPIDCAAIAEPLAMAWVSSRLAQMQQWADRNLATEQWKLESASPNATSLSAVDLLRAANEAVEAFFKLRLQQAAPVLALTQGIAQLLEGYAARLTRQLGDGKLLHPTPPELTRYKKPAVELLMQERARTPLPPQPPSFLAMDVDEVLMMFASLNFLLRELPATDHSIQRQWMSLSQHTSTLRRGSQDVGLSGLFSAVRRALTEGRARMLERVTHTVVFHHLRASFLDGAYVFGTQREAGRLPAALLEPLNPWMTHVCDILAADERADFAYAMLSAAAQGIRHVLLDGGACRIFTQDDCVALEADLASVIAFFEAEGDGVPPEEVQATLQPLSRLLDAMAFDTHSLIAAYEAEARGGTSRGLGADALLRVLCHRADRTASKFLKARLHTPKPVGFVQEKLAILAARKKAAQEAG